MEKKMKYYIKRTNQRTGQTLYKKNKCVDGWNANKSLCWEFSKQGAMKIIKRLEESEAKKKPFFFNGIEQKPDQFKYTIEEA